MKENPPCAHNSHPQFQCFTAVESRLPFPLCRHVQKTIRYAHPPADDNAILKRMIGGHPQRALAISRVDDLLSQVFKP
jgi:hypothetical protein